MRTNAWKPVVKSVVALLALGLLPVAHAGAPGRAYTPLAGSAERKAIMDALRKPVEKELNRPVVFRVSVPSDFRAQNGWAFLTADLRRPDGSPMDFRGTPYPPSDFNGGGVNALLHRTNGRWRVVTYILCATDVEWEDWSKKYHAPRAIFSGFSGAH